MLLPNSLRNEIKENKSVINHRWFLPWEKRCKGDHRENGSCGAVAETETSRDRREEAGEEKKRHIQTLDVSGIVKEFIEGGPGDG